MTKTAINKRLDKSSSYQLFQFNDAITELLLKLSFPRHIVSFMRPNPQSDTIIFSASLMGSRELIAELGGDPDTVISAARVPVSAFETADIFIDAESLIDYLELAAEHCNCPEFGLIHGSRLPMGIFGHIWLLMRDAKTVRAALQCFVKYYGLFTDMGAFRFEAADGGQWLHYSLNTSGRFGNRQVINASLAVICLFIKGATHKDWQPLRVRLRQDGSNADSVSQFFGHCPDFNNNTDALFIDNSVLGAEIGSGELGRLSKKSALIRSKMGGSIVLTEVKSILRLLLPYEECSIATIAETMRLSERTLQRKLENLGTCFRAVIDSVRADLAWHHITSSQLPISQVADLAGYKTQSAFGRAFRRWYNQSPREARLASLD
jgi:AraC-like DNA-binding protein